MAPLPFQLSLPQRSRFRRFTSIRIKFDYLLLYSGNSLKHPNRIGQLIADPSGHGFLAKMTNKFESIGRSVFFVLYVHHVLYVNRSRRFRNAYWEVVEILCFAGSIICSIEEESSGFRYHRGYQFSSGTRSVSHWQECGVGFIWKIRSIGRRFDWNVAVAFERTALSRYH